MFRLIGTLIIFGGLLLGASQTAVAHGRGYDRYVPPQHYRVSNHRHDHMPAWLRKNRGFRGWYRHSLLRHNYDLQWWQLHEIYRWEKQYDSRRRRHRTAYYKHRDYDWYRRYWRDYDRHRRNHRHDTRRRHRSRD